MSALSSSGVHASFLISGFRWLCHLQFQLFRTRLVSMLCIVPYQAWVQTCNVWNRQWDFLSVWPMFVSQWSQIKGEGANSNLFQRTIIEQLKLKEKGAQQNRKTDRLRGPISLPFFTLDQFYATLWQNSLNHPAPCIEVTRLQHWLFQFTPSNQTSGISDVCS